MFLVHVCDLCHSAPCRDDLLDTCANPVPEIRDPKSGSETQNPDPKPDIRIPKPEIRIPKRETGKQEASLKDLAESWIVLEVWTLNPTPKTLNPKS